MPKVEKDLTSTNQKLVKDTIQHLTVNQELPNTATNLIITTPRTSCIYFLPKIQKPNNPGRPIVSACSCPTELISSYLDRIMTPIVKSLPSYIKDSTHALQIFRHFNFSGQDKLIFTMDITAIQSHSQQRKSSSKVSISGKVLCTSVHYKPTDSRSYLLYSSSRPSHDTIP